jgi:hypothetical protein
MTSQPLTNDDLADLDAAVAAALAAQDPSLLNVLGFGELSVALGWPIDEPQFVCKRTPPFTPAQFDQYSELVIRYVDDVRAAGLAVVDTQVRRVDQGGRITGYLVQPLLPVASLGHKVLGASEPDPDHPFLAALGEALAVVSSQLSIDAQITNFSWDGTELTLLDVGTPFLWDSADVLEFDMDPFLVMIPAVFRSLVKRDMSKVVDRWRERRRVAIDVVANLYRERLDGWVDPMIVALNRTIEPEEPIAAAEARGFYEEDLRTWPRLKKLQRLERTWQTRVRRRPYEFFIHSTFGDDQTY